MPVMVTEPFETITDHDLVVVGCGIAGIAAGVRAAQLGTSVAILEKSPEERRGGQTRFTSGIRIPTTDTDLRGHGVPVEDPDTGDLLDYAPEHLPSYSPEDLYNDLMRMTKGESDEALARTLVTNLGPTIEWMTEMGVEWEKVVVTGQTNYPRIIHNGRMGRGTIAQLIDSVRDDLDLYYDTEARQLHLDDRSRIRGVSATMGDRRVRFACRAVVVASGGFESNAAKRTEYLGPEYANLKVRGSRYNTGEALDMALDIGAAAVGDWGNGHITLVDPAVRDVEGAAVLGPDGIKRGTKVAGHEFGVLVNTDGERFVDEGMDTHDVTYGVIGRTVFEQPNNVAYLLYDSKVNDRCYSEGPTEPTVGESIEEVARGLGIPAVERTIETVEQFNRACDPGEFDPTSKDENATTGIRPPKSNWALPLDDPPFYGLPLTGGATYAPYGGVKIDENARVHDTRDNPIPGLYAAGNCTGGLIKYNKPNSIDQANAAVYGKLAAEHAAEYLG